MVSKGRYAFDMEGSGWLKTDFVSVSNAACLLVTDSVSGHSRQICPHNLAFSRAFYRMGFLGGTPVTMDPARVQDREGAALVLDNRTRHLFPFVERIYSLPKTLSPPYGSKTRHQSRQPASGAAEIGAASLLRYG
jgi:hypothetical protein